MEKLPEMALPPIPVKRYFTIGEVAELCGVKPHVLRYWEQEFTQLRPMKRRGNRRYYQHHEVLMIRRIRDLLYDQGFTISGARNKLQEMAQAERERRRSAEQGAGADDAAPAIEAGDEGLEDMAAGAQEMPVSAQQVNADPAWMLDAGSLGQLRRELHEIRSLLAENY